MDYRGPKEAGHLLNMLMLAVLLLLTFILISYSVISPLAMQVYQPAYQYLRKSSSYLPMALTAVALLYAGLSWKRD